MEDDSRGEHHILCVADLPPRRVDDALESAVMPIERHSDSAALDSNDRPIQRRIDATVRFPLEEWKIYG
jgi:hypothetical protein